MFSKHVSCNGDLVCKLSLYFINATSLAKPNALQLLSTDIISNSTHVALVVETWFHDSVPDDQILLANYTLVRLDRNPAQKRKGGGICFYVRNDVQTTVIKHRNVKEPNLEYMWIRCEFDSVIYVIACIYHPPPGRVMIVLCLCVNCRLTWTSC